MIASVWWPLATGTRGSLASVADSLFEGMTPPPRFDGLEFIPSDSPFVMIMNHYESPHAAAWWGPLLMVQAIARCRTREPRGVHGIIAREWWYSDGFGRAVKQPLTRWFFARLAHVYGLILVPPVLQGVLTRGQGVAGVRQALALTRGAHPQLVALAPEGGTGRGGALKEPPQGAGSFLLLLTHGTIPCLPAGWYQEESREIKIQFGAPFQLRVPQSPDRHARDRAAATKAMTEIRKLLPEPLWGEYRPPLLHNLST